jgi:hypothetical protein
MHGRASLLLRKLLQGFSGNSARRRRHKSLPVIASRHHMIEGARKLDSDAARNASFPDRPKIAVNCQEMLPDPNGAYLRRPLDDFSRSASGGEEDDARRSHLRRGWYWGSEAFAERMLRNGEAALRKTRSRGANASLEKQAHGEQEAVTKRHFKTQSSSRACGTKFRKHWR